MGRPAGRLDRHFKVSNSVICQVKWGLPCFNSHVHAKTSSQSSPESCGDMASAPDPCQGLLETAKRLQETAAEPITEEEEALIGPPLGARPNPNALSDLDSFGVVRPFCSFDVRPSTAQSRRHVSTGPGSRSFISF